MYQGAYKFLATRVAQKSCPKPLGSAASLAYRETRQSTLFTKDKITKPTHTHTPFLRENFVPSNTSGGPIFLSQSLAQLLAFCRWKEWGRWGGAAAQHEPGEHETTDANHNRFRTREDFEHDFHTTARTTHAPESGKSSTSSSSSSRCCCECVCVCVEFSCESMCVSTPPVQHGVGF